MSDHAEHHPKLTPFARFAHLAAAAILTVGVVTLVLQGHSRIREWHAAEIHRRNRAFRAHVAWARMQVEAGRHARAMRLLKPIGEGRLTDDQRRRWHIAMGDCLQVRAARSDKEDRYTDLLVASRHYRRAADLADDAAARFQTEIKWAEMALLQEDWDLAVERLQPLVTAAADTESRNRVRFMLERAFDHLGRAEERARILAGIMEDAETTAVWGAAAMKRARILVDGAASPDGAPPPDGSEADAALDEAYGLCLETVERLPRLSQDVSRARTLAVRVLVLLGDMPAAYRAVNKNLSLPLTADQKADCLLELAGLHQRKGELDKAVAVLRVGVSTFPETDAVDRVMLQLYQIQTLLKNWHQALRIAEELAPRVRDSAMADALLERLLHEECPLWAAESFGKAGRGYRLRALRLVDTIRNGPAGGEPLVRSLLAYLQGKLMFNAGNYRDAEKHFAQCLNINTDINEADIEKVSHRDILCARRLERSPITVAYRAHRYLDRFPSGPNAEEVLMLLLDAYCRMGLYDSAMRIANRAFVGELKKMGQAGDFEVTEKWVTTVARIVQCYQKLGFHDRVNRIFRTHGAQLLAHMPEIDLFLNWADTASQAGQNREALRRLAIASEAARTPWPKLRTKVAQNVLMAKLRDKAAVSEARGLAKALRAELDLTKAPNQQLLKQLYGALLDYTAAEAPDELGDLLREAAVTFNNKEWLAYWILRHGNTRPDQTKELAGELQQSLRDGLDKLDPDRTLLELGERQLKITRSLAEIVAEAETLKQRGWYQ